MATFITNRFLKRISKKGRLVEALSLYEKLSDSEKAKLPKLPKLSSWECVLEEVLDTDHEPEGYLRFVNELINRGYSSEDIMNMRIIAWETAGWLNYEMMVWDWCNLNEKDMLDGLKDRFDKKNISKTKFEQLKQQIEHYKSWPNQRVDLTR